MATIILDTDKIINELLPLSECKYQHIGDAYSHAKKVADDTNWSRIVGQLEDCVNQTKKYIEWLKNTNTAYVNTINTGIEEINNTKIEEVEKCKLVVK